MLKKSKNKDFTIPTKKEILTSLPLLKKQDLLDIQDRIKFLLKNYGITIQTEKSNRSGFYEIIASTITKFTNEVAVPYNVIRGKNTFYFKKFTEVHDFVDSFVESSLSEPPKKQVRYKSYRLFSEMLCKYLKTVNSPINLNSVLNSYKSFPRLVEDGFPGYIQNGLGSIVFGQRRFYYKNKDD